MANVAILTMMAAAVTTCGYRCAVHRTASVSRQRSRSSVGPHRVTPRRRLWTGGRGRAEVGRDTETMVRLMAREGRLLDVAPPKRLNPNREPRSIIFGALLACWRISCLSLWSGSAVQAVQASARLPCSTLTARRRGSLLAARPRLTTTRRCFGSLVSWNMPGYLP